LVSSPTLRALGTISRANSNLLGRQSRHVRLDPGDVAARPREIARLKAEGENLRAAVAALPLPSLSTPPEKTGAEQAFDDLTKGTKP
jgi:hypothetical protein